MRNETGFWFDDFCPIAGFDPNARLIEEEDSACPALLEQDFNRFHHSIPGLRRSGVDANAIRQVNEKRIKTVSNEKVSSVAVELTLKFFFLILMVFYFLIPFPCSTITLMEVSLGTKKRKSERLNRRRNLKTTLNPCKCYFCSFPLCLQIGAGSSAAWLSSLTY